MYLKKGTNSKLGKQIAAFSIPAISTCPGSTKLCRSFCYAEKGFYHFPKIKQSLKNNYQATKQKDFVDKINLQLKRSRTVEGVRIHPSGDFYSEEYILKWLDIIRANPNISFWAYTRSWRIKSLLPALRKLKAENNIQLFASIDKELKDNKEKPPIDFRLADVVKDWDTADSSYVRCPNQKNNAISCQKCSYCFKPETKNKQNVIFKEH